MKALLIRCYPAAWRDRYGTEFEAILDERPLGPYDAADIFIGALDARLRARRRGVRPITERRITMSRQIGGYAAILGSLLWGAGTLLGFVASTDPFVPSLLFVAAWLAFFVALVGLSSVQSRAHPTLTWVAVALPVVGALIGILGIVGMHTQRFGVGFTYWSLFNLTAVPAMAFSVFALVTYYLGVLSRPAALLLLIGSVLLPVLMFWSGEAPAAIVGMGLIAAGWFWLGVEAVRFDRPATAPRPS